MIDRIHYISQEINGLSHEEHVEIACKNAISWVQLRVKDKSVEEWESIAFKVKRVCDRYKARLIINDSVAIAKKTGAYGVHLGKEDMNPSEARKILGSHCIIGGTANTIEDVIRLFNAGVDYIGLGPFRYTTTKIKLSPILGLNGYREIMKEMRSRQIVIPVVAIGGILPADVPGLMQTGIHGIAVSSAINMSKDKQTVIKSFIESVSY